MEPNLRLAFFKLNVPEIVPALAFWREAFGFEVAQTFDEAEFHEKVLALPGQAAGPNLMLVTYKDGRDVTVPVVTIYRAPRELIEDYRVYIDLAPLFAA